MQKYDFVILGGDKRLAYTAEEFIKRGYKTGVFANCEAMAVRGCGTFSCLKEAMESTDNIVSGIPFFRDGKLNAPLCETTVTADDIAEHLLPSHIVAAGMVGDFALVCAKKGALCADYGKREDFCMLNAVPTAEAAIGILINNLPVTLWGSKILIIGYGRIGKVLSQRLKSLGANVTVTARKSSDFAISGISGIKCVSTGPYIDNGYQFDAVINTVPEKILTDKSFSQLRPDCFVMDVSAYPGYVSSEEAGVYGIKVTGAFSLPGKNSPVTAGRIIADVVTNICDELKGV